MMHDVTTAPCTPAEHYAHAVEAVGLGARTQQLAIVEAVCSEEDAVLALEAPTGTGKSLGALFGAAARCSASGLSRVAVATYTNVLREQYLVDLDRARRAFPRIRFATVAGAGAYTCRNRARDEHPSIHANDKAEILRFLARTTPGRSSTALEAVALADQRLARYVKADADECATDDRCRTDGECGLYAARKVAADAQVVVTNHALLAINARAYGGVIGQFDAIVIDEVHRLGEALRSSVSVNISANSLRRARGLLNDTEVESQEKLIVAMNKMAPRNETFAGASKWSWEDFAQPFDSSKFQRRIAMCMIDAKDANKRIKKAAEHHLEFDHFGDSNEDPRCKKCRSLRRDQRRADAYQGALKHLHTWTTCSVEPEPGDIRQNVGTVRRYRRDAGGTPAAHLTLTPVDTSELATELVESVSVLVAVSATVGTESDPAYALTEAGLDQHLTAPVVRLPPAFEYETQMFARFDRRPGPETERLFEALELSDGRALILTRSHRRKDDITHTLRSVVGSQLTVLAQPAVEDAASRGAVVHAFAADERSVLIGTNSYREGINVSGNALRHVIMADAPFIAFGPLQRQLDINLRAEGRTWVQAHKRPQTEMIIEQSAGRLIRSHQDSGWFSWIAVGGSDARWLESRFDAAMRRFGALNVEDIR